MLRFPGLVTRLHAPHPVSRDLTPGPGVVFAGNGRCRRSRTTETSARRFPSELRSPEQSEFQMEPRWNLILDWIPPKRAEQEDNGAGLWPVLPSGTDPGWNPEFFLSGFALRFCSLIWPGSWTFHSIESLIRSEEFRESRRRGRGG